MNKKKGITTIIVAMAMFCMMSMSALAATTQHIYLGAGQVWTVPYPITRTGDYSYVCVKCDAVYPSIGADNITKIQVRLVDSSDTSIIGGNYYILTEGAGYTKVYIKDGYLSDTVYIQFRGNTKDAAEATVSYYSN